eukprot:scaffold662094_cov107-Prasinocladus_malaysianus.AAC.1
MNPHVQSALDAWSHRKLRAAMAPRGRAASCSNNGQETKSLVSNLVGTNSFGMSGVNAHASMTTVNNVATAKVHNVASHTWNREMLWPHARSCPL